MAEAELPARLYRGVNAVLYRKLAGMLRPKSPGAPFSSMACCGEPHAVCGSGVVAGDCVTNEAVRHQWRQLGLPTSGVSTTPYVERAEFYALSGGGVAEGCVYEISTARCARYGVAVYCVRDLSPSPSIPEDDEHILVASDFGVIPSEVVLAVERVYA